MTAAAEEQVTKLIDYLEKAIQMNPQFAPAYRRFHPYIR